eukprot:10186001-Karenia_brevis.AAC.2
MKPRAFKTACRLRGMARRCWASTQSSVQGRKDSKGGEVEEAESRDSLEPPAAVTGEWEAEEEYFN